MNKLKMRLSPIDYSDAFSGIDDQMSGWITNTFSVSDPDGTE